MIYIEKHVLFISGFIQTDRMRQKIQGWLVGWLCLMSHRQRGHLETAPPFTVPFEAYEARFLHRSHWESNPGPPRGSPLHIRCAMQALYKDFPAPNLIFSRSILSLFIKLGMLQTKYSEISH